MADWVTTASYLVAGILCSRAGRKAAKVGHVRDRRFWRTTAWLCAFLAVNELLDLQTLLTVIGRAHAKAHGWYGEHRQYQYAFVLALTAMAVIVGTAVIWLTRSAHFSVRMALAGLVFIGLFVLLRAASFHHLDDLLGRGAQMFNWGSVQEIAGIVLVGAAAVLYPRRRGSRRQADIAAG